MENKQSMMQIWYCRLHIPGEAQLDHSFPNVRTDVDMQRMVEVHVDVLFVQLSVRSSNVTSTKMVAQKPVYHVD